MRRKPAQKSDASIECRAFRPRDGRPRVLASLLYVTLQRPLQLVALACRSEEFKELEIVVLRHDSRSFGARSRGLHFGGPIGRSLPLRAGAFRASAGTRSSSCRTRSCAGIASLSRDAGPIRQGSPGDLRSALRPASSSSASRARIPGGAISGSRASSPRSGSASRRRRFASSFARQGSDLRAGEPASPGASSSAARRRACSRALLHR